MGRVRLRAKMDLFGKLVGYEKVYRPGMTAKGAEPRRKAKRRAQKASRRGNR